MNNDHDNKKEAIFVTESLAYPVQFWNIHTKWCNHIQMNTLQSNQFVTFHNITAILPALETYPVDTSTSSLCLSLCNVINIWAHPYSTWAEKAYFQPQPPWLHTVHTAKSLKSNPLSSPQCTCTLWMDPMLSKTTQQSNWNVTTKPCCTDRQQELTVSQTHQLPVYNPVICWRIITYTKKWSTHTHSHTYALHRAKAMQPNVTTISSSLQLLEIWK